MRSLVFTIVALAAAACSTLADTVHLPFRGLQAQQTPPTSSRPFFIIADLDANSKDVNASKLSFVSYLQHGTLDIWKGTSGDRYGVRWGDKEKATSSINDAGRGFELSELAWYLGKLFTLDDRTGIVYELLGFTSSDSSSLKAIPEDIVMEGNGISGKGQKHEWATVKDNELYLGSNGVVVTDAEGKADHAREWVAILDVDNNIRHVDWSANYQRVREALGVKDPGYVTHEAVEWSAIHKKWFLLPRRVSKEAFNETLDARRGANTLIVASEDFQRIEAIQIRAKSATPERGFASFKFVKDTNDSVIVAIKSVELDNAQDSYMTVFDIHGNALLDDIEIPGKSKYEGLAFAAP